MIHTTFVVICCDRFHLKIGSSKSLFVLWLVRLGLFVTLSLFVYSFIQVLIPYTGSLYKSMAECNTILSAYTKYRHLG